MNDETDSSSAAPPQDQAHGLRQLFGHARVRVVPVVSNPHMAFGGVMLERVCTAFTEQNARVLVIDAGDRAPTPAEIAVMDLGDCIENLSPQVFYLAARGLPLRYVDAHGSTAEFLQAAMDAAPLADVVLMHANESDLCRLFMHTTVRPLLLADDRPASVTHAYGAMKLISQRAGLMVYDLLLCAAASSPRVERIAVQLAHCADQFVGAVLRDCLHVDPAASARDPTTPALKRWAHEVMHPSSGPIRGASLPLQRELPSQQALN